MGVFKTNQKVLVKSLDTGNYQIVCLQDHSTPGIYKEIQTEAQSEYRVELRGFKNARGRIVIWIANNKNKNIYLSKESLPEKQITTISYQFKSNVNRRLRIGCLFIGCGRGCSFVLERMSITRVTHLRPPTTIISTRPAQKLTTLPSKQVSKPKVSKKPTQPTVLEKPKPPLKPQEIKKKTKEAKHARALIIRELNFERKNKIKDILR
jgi:hypothetical protein